MIGVGECVGENDVIVENIVDGVGNGFVYVVIFDEYGVECGDCIVFFCFGVFEEVWEYCKY